MKNKNKTLLSSSEFLRDLILSPGPSGFENCAAACWRRNLEESGIHTMVDLYGNSIATVNPNATTSVMLLAHIDTIGLMVKYIDDDGFIYISEIGGFDTLALIGQHVIILSDPQVCGVIGRRPVHLEDEDDKNPKLHDLRIDVGAKKKSEIIDFIPIGTPVVLQPKIVNLMNNRISGVGLDDRIGAWCIAEALKKLSKSDKLKVKVHAVASVQEETGLHGAHMVAEQLHPNMALGVDVTFAIDTPDLEKTHYGETSLGKGAVVSIGGSSHPHVVRELINTANDARIDIQREANPNSYGYIEADAVFRSCGGVLTGAVSIPVRYMHTSVEVIQLDDAKAVVDLIVSWCERLI